MQIARVELLADCLELGTEPKSPWLACRTHENGNVIRFVRFVQIEIHLLAAGVPFGSHDVLNVIEE